MSIVHYVLHLHLAEQCQVLLKDAADLILLITFQVLREVSSGRLLQELFPELILIFPEPIPVHLFILLYLATLTISE